MTQRKKPPEHLLTHARTARNAQDKIIAIVDKYNRDEIDEHNAFIQILRLAGGAKRELEQIRGVETPPDENFLKVVNGG